MKKNVNELIKMINKLEYLKRIQKKNEELIEDADEYIENFYFEMWAKQEREELTQIDEIDNINDILFELADEIDFVINNVEKKIKFIFEYIFKLNIEDFQFKFKGYTYKEIVIAFCILVDLEIRINDYNDLVNKMNKILSEGINNYEQI